MGKLNGKVAIVSGAARGQGRSHAMHLAAEGADIVALDICADLEGNTYPLARPEDLDETVRLVQKESVRCYSAIVDVRERSAVWQAIADAVADFGRLDVVVANAGICPVGRELSMRAWSDTIDTNLGGAFNVIQASIPHIGEGASIVATGSLAADLGGMGGEGQPGASAYTFSKQTLAHYVHDLSLQLARRKIRVNAVHPTGVDTDMLHNDGIYQMFRPDVQSPTREDAEVAFPRIQAMPVPYVEPADVSHAVVFLACDESRYITGTQLRIDAGGYVKARRWHS